MHALCHLPSPALFFLFFSSDSHDAARFRELAVSDSSGTISLSVFTLGPKHTFGDFPSFLFCDWAAMATFLLSQRLWLLGCVPLLQHLLLASSVTFCLHYGLCHLPLIYI